MSDTRTEAERYRDAADSIDGGQTLFVLIVSTGLIPAPMVFRTEQEAREAAILEIADDPHTFVYSTLEGASAGAGAGAEAGKLDDMGKAELAELLVDDYLMKGGCIFNNDSGDELRLFETKFMEAEA